MKKLIVLTGSTATGKTDIAIQLCKEFQGEIIAADSRQVYKGLDIGSGKASSTDIVEKHDGWWKINDIPVHGYDLAEPMTRFSADHFRRFAQRKIKDLWKGQKLPFLVGGTWLYIKAVVDQLSAMGIPPNTKLRERLDGLSMAELQNELCSVNEARLIQMNDSDRQNPRRLIRAIEIATSKPSFPQQKTLEASTIVFGLTAPQRILFQRIDQRLQHRLEKGLIEEIERLESGGMTHQRLEELGLEYRFVSRYLRGVLSKEEMIQQLQHAIHRYAKRQLLFMRKDRRINWFDITKESFYDTIKKALERFIHDTKN